MEARGNAFFSCVEKEKIIMSYNKNHSGFVFMFCNAMIRALPRGRAIVNPPLMRRNTP